MAGYLLRNCTQGTGIISLREGVQRVGRVPENDIEIADDSVSRHHCEIRVNEGEVWVRDLGSANGTFIDQQPVGEALLKPRQSLRLGSVDLTLEADLPVPPPVPKQPGKVVVRIAKPATTVQAEQVPESWATGVPDGCAQHATVRAKYICYSCGRLLCPACTKTTRIGNHDYYSCVACGKTAGLLETYKRQNDRSAQSFFQLLPGAFAYPFKQNGMYILVGGALFFSLLQWAQMIAKYALFYGMAALAILGITSVGYMFAYMKSIVTSTASGSDAPPGWPEITSFMDSLVSPFFQFAITALVCLGPGMIAMNYAPPLVGVALLVCGLFCMPMAMLTVSMADSVIGLNPLLIFSSICKLPGAYLTACGVFLVTLALRAGVEQLLAMAGAAVFLAPIVHFFSIYAVAVQMRIMGLLYVKNKDQLT